MEATRNATPHTGGLREGSAATVYTCVNCGDAVILPDGERPVKHTRCRRGLEMPIDIAATCIEILVRAPLTQEN